MVPGHRGAARASPPLASPSPAPGSDVAGLRTKAEKKGDKYIINGTKQFISHADVADYICVAAVTDPETRPPTRAARASSWWKRAPRA